MTWPQIMQRILPPIGGKLPHVTSPYGATNRPPGSTNPHRAVDFNYFGNQRGINLTHPALRSPVTGVVTHAGTGKVGMIAIRDANGLSHEILHTNGRYVSVGNPVAAGQLIGTMGNTGTTAHHVHYQLKDPAGNIINPSAFWDQQGPTNPNPDPPAYVGEFKKYLQGLGVKADNGFGDRAAGASGTAAPFDASGDVEPADRQNSFDARFGRWASAPADVFPSTARDGGESFDSRFGNWGSSPADGSGDTNAIVRTLKRYGRSTTSDAPPELAAPFPAQVPSSDYSNPLPVAAPSNSSVPPNDSIQKWIASLAGDYSEGPPKYSQLPIFSPFFRR